MTRRKRPDSNRLVQTTVSESTYAALCERSTVEDRSMASLIRQAITFYFAHLDRIRKVELD